MQAHSLPVDNGTINVSNNKAYVVLSLPVKALTNVDDNEDGKLSYNELKKHNSSIKNQILKGFSFTNYTKSNASTQKLNILSIKPTTQQHAAAHNHAPQKQSTLKSLKATHLNVLATIRFPKTIKKLQVKSHFFKHTAKNYHFNLYAKHAKSIASNGKKITREHALLSAKKTSAWFFSK